MAETAVSASKGVIGALFEKLTKLVEDKCTNLVGMSKNIVFLKDELPTMSALLEKLEDADELDPVVKAWRNQVREMAYDIEDCIDDFVHHVGGGDVEAGFIDKVSHFLRTLRARLETAEHIKDLKIQLIEINERRKRYKFNLDGTPSSSFVAIDPRLPALYSEAANLVGIEGPREQVIKWLTDADQQIMVLPIVGFGGLGKTTLAKELKTLLTTSEHIYSIEGTFLLLMTCGMHLHGILFGLFFQKMAWAVEIFGSEDGCPSQFREISAQILKKCSGLPLAIITIASLLANQPAPHKKEYWESIRNSIGTWGSGTNPTLEGMRQILHLSYKDLPRHLRTCFLYLGIYPEDFTIKKDDLIRQWLAEGFVYHFHGGSSDEVAKSYFNELINRSLIQPEETKYGEVVSCRVHDMMLDLILSRCAEDNFICVAYNLEELSGKHEFKVRRLLVDSRVGDSGDTKISRTTARRLLQLRSLQLFGVSLSLLSLSKYIRVLILHLGKTGTGGNERVDVTAIGQLFQLRYLKIVSLHHALVIELPTEIQGLQYLSTLEIDCTNENSLPSDIVHLSRLSHLIVPSGIGLPDGKIGSMKSLCTLQKFEILDIKSAISLGELTNLKDLELYSKQAL
uniref:Rx N-terminal domain-containing protein n=1 Tax=Oryza glumipatula TaxID=40148 RepID=A0A0E0AS32_9ORYZ